VKNVCKIYTNMSKFWQKCLQTIIVNSNISENLFSEFGYFFVNLSNLIYRVTIQCSLMLFVTVKSHCLLVTAKTYIYDNNFCYISATRQHEIDWFVIYIYSLNITICNATLSTNVTLFNVTLYQVTICNVTSCNVTLSTFCNIKFCNLTFCNVTLSTNLTFCNVTLSTNVTLGN